MPWGAVVGGVISAGASLLGSSQGAKQDLTGYNYLTGANGVTGYVNNGNAANGAAASLLGVGGGGGGGGTPAGGLLYAKQSSRGNTPLQDIQAAQAQGKTITAAQWAQAGYNPDGTPMQGASGASGAAGANSAFNNYLNSTGYKFQMQQGTQAITGNQAARGLLGSGGTAKALAQYGQGLGGEYFNNYLNQLGNVAGRGLTASGQIGQAGTQGGAAAGQSTGTGIAGAGGLLGGAASGAYNNFFSPGSTNGNYVPDSIPISGNQLYQ